MSGAVEIVKAVVSPATKLIECVSKAIGKVYEPTHTKRTARAEAEKIKIIANAIRENADIPIVYDNGQIIVDAKEYEELIKRTQGRLAFQEIRKQENIEKVFSKSYDILENETECSEEPVDQDWILRFFNCVEDISNEQMQDLWAKVLAGEVKKPKTFSLRTLETLRNLSEHEAKLFAKYAQKVLCVRSDAMFLNNDLKNNNYMNFLDLLKLQDCGLLQNQVLESSAYVLPSNGSKSGFNLIVTQDYVFTIINATKQEIKCKFNVYKLSNAGYEIYKIINVENQIDDLKYFADKIHKQNPTLKFKIYKIHRENDVINYYHHVVYEVG